MATSASLINEWGGPLIGQRGKRNAVGAIRTRQNAMFVGAVLASKKVGENE